MVLFFISVDLVKEKNKKKRMSDTLNFDRVAGSKYCIWETLCSVLYSKPLKKIKRPLFSSTYLFT